MTLYEISNELREKLENMEVNEDGEVIGAEEIEAVQDTFENKVEGVACFIKELEADIAALKAQEDSFKQRRASAEKKLENLNNYLASNMLAVDMKKFETAKVKLSFRKSESVEVLDLDALPEIYVKEKIEYSADKTALKKALKDGAELDGAKLVVKMNLQVK